jgi:hypothetical protein
LSHYILKHNLKRHENLKNKINFKIKKNNSEKEYKKFDEILKQYYEFSRSNELQADSLGLILFKNAGYSLSHILNAISSLEYSTPIFFKHKYEHQQLDPETNFGIHNALNSSCELNKNYKILGVTLRDDESEDDFEKDSLYSSHPDWKERYLVMEKYLKNYTFNQINPTKIPNNILHECYSESFFNEYKNANYIKALAYLLLLEKHLGNNEITQKWKGISLASIYFNYFHETESLYLYENAAKDTNEYTVQLFKHLITLKKSDLKNLAIYFNSYNLEDNDLNKMNKFYLNKLLYSSIKDKETKTLSDSIQLFNCLNVKESFYLNPNYFKIINQYVNDLKIDSFYNTWQSSNSIITASSIYDSKYNKDLIPQKKYKKAENDTLLLMSPFIMFLPGNQTQKYKNPKNLKDKKEFIYNKLIEWGEFYKIYYTSLNFDDKEKLSTETYNQYFYSTFIIEDFFSEDFLNQDDEQNILPISVIICDEIIKNTGAKKIQFLQVINKDHIDLTSIITRTFFEIFSFPFSIFTTFDFGTYDVIGNRSTVFINIMINLENANLDDIIVFENNQKANEEALTASIIRIQSNTKKQLIKKQ